MTPAQYKQKLKQFFESLAVSDTDATKLRKLDEFRRIRGVSKHLKHFVLAAWAWLGSTAATLAQTTLIPSQDDAIYGTLGQKFQNGEFEIYDLGLYVKYLTEFLILIGGGIAILFIVIGGYQYMIGGATEDKDAGKKTIIYAVGGFIVTLLAWVLVNGVQVFVTSGDGEATDEELVAEEAQDLTSAAEPAPASALCSSSAPASAPAACFGSSLADANKDGAKQKASGSCEAAIAALKPFCQELAGKESCTVKELQTKLISEKMYFDPTTKEALKPGCSKPDGLYGQCTKTALDNYRASKCAKDAGSSKAASGSKSESNTESKTAHDTAKSSIVKDKKGEKGEISGPIERSASGGAIGESPKTITSHSGSVYTKVAGQPNSWRSEERKATYTGQVGKGTINGVGNTWTMQGKGTIKFDGVEGVERTGEFVDGGIKTGIESMLTKDNKKMIRKGNFEKDKLIGTVMIQYIFPDGMIVYQTGVMGAQPKKIGTFDDIGKFVGCFIDGGEMIRDETTCKNQGVITTCPAGQCTASYFKK